MFTQAIAQLEQAGTIDSAQAQAIDTAMQSECSFDIQQLVNNGTITAAQKQAVVSALGHAKMSLAGANHANTARAGHHRHLQRHHRHQ